MREILSWLKDGLMVLGLTVLMILGMALIAIFIRPLMIITLVAVFCGVVLSMFSPRVRAWVESAAQY